MKELFGFGLDCGGAGVCWEFVSLMETSLPKEGEHLLKPNFDTGIKMPFSKG